MPISKRQRILEAFRTRLQAISVKAGFNTDAGAAVSLGELLAPGPDDPAVQLAVAVGDDELTYQGEKVTVTLPVEIHVMARANLDEPWAAVEAALADVKQAVELTDRTLGYLVNHQIRRGQTRTLPRESGSEWVGAVITYEAPYSELWGAPEQ